MCIQDVKHGEILHAFLLCICTLKASMQMLEAVKIQEQGYLNLFMHESGLIDSSIQTVKKTPALPAKTEAFPLRKISFSTLLVTWCTDIVWTSPNTVVGGDRSGQLQTSSSSLLSGWTPNTLATRLSGTGAWAQAARRTNTYKRTLNYGLSLVNKDCR